MPGVFPPSLSAAASALVALAVALAGALGPAPAAARDDHERAREAVESGQAQPLRYILEVLERSHPGRVLEVELEQHHDQWIYEVKLLQPDGRLVKLKVDAKTGAVLPRR